MGEGKGGGGEGEGQCRGDDIVCTVVCTVELPNKGHAWDSAFCPL